MASATIGLSLVILISVLAISAGTWLGAERAHADEIDDIYYYCNNAYYGDVWAIEDCIDREYDAMMAREYGSDSYYDDGYDDGLSSTYSTNICPGVYYQGTCVCDRCPDEFSYGSYSYQIYERCHGVFESQSANGWVPCAVR